jgi:hypothetical protein
MVNQGLLKTLTECEYPAEFLVARLLGKKSTLFRNWESLIASSDRLQNLQNSPFYPYLKKYGTSGIWRFLQDEHLWVYSRMNPFLRKTFTPYFVYHELNTLLVCLRYLYSKKEIESVQQELRNSLLHSDIQKILVSGLDFTVTLIALESCLFKQYELFKGLSELYEKKGIAALEIFIRDCFFAIIISQKQPTMLKHFMQYLIDFHNCMFLAKTLRWQTETEPDVISGGTIPGDRFRKAYFLKDMTPVVKFLHLDASGESAAEIQKLEISLLISITRKLKNRSYQRTVVGDILFYLWEQYRYTRNISMVLNTILLDDVTVLEKIVA